MTARLLISRENNQITEEIQKILKEYNLKNPHADLLYFAKDSKLGIAEARKIKEHFSKKPYSAKGKMAVIEDASLLTQEAQNSMLKTLEEPPAEAIIVMGAKTLANLLPTVLSRCEIIYLQQSNLTTSEPNYEIYEKDINNLIQYSLEQRFEYIEKLENKGEFLKALIQYFHRKLISARPKTNAKFIKELLQAEEWTYANVNIRAILEYLMLVLPVNL